MVKDHSDSERENLLPPPHGFNLPISSKGSFVCTITQQDSTYHILSYTNREAPAGTGIIGSCHDEGVNMFMSW